LLTLNFANLLRSQPLKTAINSSNYQLDLIKCTFCVHSSSRAIFLFSKNLKEMVVRKKGRSGRNPYSRNRSRRNPSGNPFSRNPHTTIVGYRYYLESTYTPFHSIVTSYNFANMRLSIPTIVAILLAFLDASNTVLADYKPDCNSGWGRTTDALNSATYKDLSTCQNSVLKFDKLNDNLIGGKGGADIVGIPAGSGSGGCSNDNACMQMCQAMCCLQDGCLYAEVYQSKKTKDYVGKCSPHPSNNHKPSPTKTNPFYNLTLIISPQKQSTKRQNTSTTAEQRRVGAKVAAVAPPTAPDPIPLVIQTALPLWRRAISNGIPPPIITF
jgi:hypothetical protein